MSIRNVILIVFGLAVVSTTAHAQYTGGIDDGYAVGTTGNFVPLCNVTSSFTPVSTTVCLGDSVLFTNTSANSTSYEWKNGTTVISTAVNETVVFGTTGTFVISLVSSSSGCTDSSAVSISVVDLPTSTNLTTDVSCFGGNDGAVNLVPVGNGPFNYAWSNSETVEDLNGVNAGTYAVLVTDVNGCQHTATTTVNEPSEIQITVTPTAHLLCFGDSTGEATVSTVGGTPSYAYVWSSGSTTATASNLAAGTHLVTITDANNCEDDGSVLILGPPELNPATVVTSNYNGADISCFGAADAVLVGSAIGGTGAHNFNWSTGDSTATVTGLGTGTFILVVTDSNNCTAADTIFISEPAELILTTAVTSNYNGVDISCFGASDGAVLGSASGGTGAYSFNWDSGVSTATATNLVAGTYALTITDANGCVAQQSVTLVQPMPLNAVLFATDETDNCNGSATATVTGGVPTYSYLWNDANAQITATASDLCAGQYCVNAMDLNGCFLDSCVTLTSNLNDTTTIVVTPTDSLRIPNVFSPNGDGINDYFRILGLPERPNSMLVFNRWGHLLFFSDDYLNNWDGTAASGLAVTEGTYFFVLRLSKGQEVRGHVTVVR